MFISLIYDLILKKTSISYDNKIFMVKMQKVLFLYFLLFKVRSMELVANYKLWDSISDALIYDYSGNSRHAFIENLKPDATFFTDRGLYFRGQSLFNLPSNKYCSNPGYSDMALSFWYYDDIKGLQRFLYIQDLTKHIRIRIDTSGSNVITVYVVIDDIKKPAFSFTLDMSNM